ncbi:MAG: MobF family relaxase [Elusimicrobiota bacterium]|nr:MobF family relaxase [Elusimicrobiota bacterium]
MKLTSPASNLTQYTFAKDANYFFKQGQEFKEVVSGDPQVGAVQVYGELCKGLGLMKGQSLTQKQFNNLAGSYRPDYDKTLNPNEKPLRYRTKVKGLDLTFSAPKSVSIAALVYKDERIIKAFQEAALETMQEQELLAAGQPRAGQFVQTGKLVYSATTDGFNRNQEPHLHVHFDVFNMTRLPNGKYVAIDMSVFLNPGDNKLRGIICNSKLNAKLRAIGYKITYEKGGFSRLDKISHEEEMQFSTRHLEIKARKEDSKKPLKDMEAWKIRHDKSELISKPEALEKWGNIHNAITPRTEEWNKEETIRLRDEWRDDAKYSLEAQQEKSGIRDNATEAQMWKLAALRAAQTQSVFSKTILMTEYLKETERQGGGVTTIDELEKRLKEQIRYGHILTAEPGNPDSRFTINEVVKAERNIINAAKDAGPQFDKPKMEMHIYDFNEKLKAGAGSYELSENQKEVLNLLLKSGHRYNAMQGDAGTGKTTIMRAYKYALDKEKIKVYGLAAAGTAARTLQEESGIKSETVALYLATAEKPKHAVIVVDEASLIGSINMDKLIRSAQVNNNKILFVGDKNQLTSIEAGDAFNCIVKELDSRGRLAYLKELHRQRDAVLKAAADSARNGDIKKSLAVFSKAKKITKIKNDEKRIKEIAGQYNKDTLIVTTTKASKTELDKQIRDSLTAAGRLSDPKVMHQQFDDQDGIAHDGEIEIMKGEQIVFTKNEYKNYDIRNGERATVKAVKDGIVAVSLEDGRNIDIDTKDYAYIDYGYSTTTYKAQGQTYDKVVINADTTNASLADMRNQYVMITRARDDVKIYTDDKARLKELAGMRTHKANTLHMNMSIEECDRRDREFKEHIRIEKSGGKIEILTTQDKIRKANAELNKRRAAAALKEPPPLPKQTPAIEIKINDDKVIARYGHSPEHIEELKQLVADTSNALNATDIPQTKKEKIAEQLNNNPQMLINPKYKPAWIIKAAQLKELPKAERLEVIKNTKDLDEMAALAKLSRGIDRFRGMEL